MGVNEVVYARVYSMDEASRRVLEMAGVKLRQMEIDDGTVVPLNRDFAG